MPLESKITFKGTVCGCLYNPESSLAYPYGRISFSIKEEKDNPKIYSLIDQLKPPIINGAYVEGEAMQLSISTPTNKKDINMVTLLGIYKCKGGEELVFFDRR